MIILEETIVPSYLQYKIHTSQETTMFKEEIYDTTDITLLIVFP